MHDKQTFTTLMSKFLEVKNILSLTESVILLQQYWHYSNVSMNSVYELYVDKFVSNIVKNANVRSVNFTNDARNNRNTVEFKKWDLVLSQNRWFFNYNVKIKYENQQINYFPARFR